MHIISSELSGGAASVLLSSAGAGLDILLHNGWLRAWTLIALSNPHSGIGRWSRPLFEHRPLSEPATKEPEEVAVRSWS